MSAEHGTYARYARSPGGCRCEECRKAKADYMRQRRAGARALAAKHTRSSTGRHANPHTTWALGATRHVATDVTHGTRFGYEERGCRCRDCTAARAESDRRYRARAS